jgi:hypothetical protein
MQESYALPWFLPANIVFVAADRTKGGGVPASTLPVRPSERTVRIEGKALKSPSVIEPEEGSTR